MTEPKKLTRWFPNSINPARDGVYQVRFVGLSNSTLYSRWHQGEWKSNNITKELASKEVRQSVHARLFGDVLQWRGLTEQPKGQQ